MSRLDHPKWYGIWNWWQIPSNALSKWIDIDFPRFPFFSLGRFPTKFGVNKRTMTWPTADCESLCAFFSAYLPNLNRGQQREDIENSCSVALAKSTMCVIPFSQSVDHYSTISLSDERNHSQLCSFCDAFSQFASHFRGGRGAVLSLQPLGQGIIQSVDGSMPKFKVVQSDCSHPKASPCLSIISPSLLFSNGKVARCLNLNYHHRKHCNTQKSEREKEKEVADFSS